MKSISTIQIKHCYLLVLTCLFLTNLSFAQITVSGRLGNEIDAPMPGYAILVSGTENKVTYTDNNGNYSFTLEQGGSYEIRPLDCISNTLNGVTTYDLVLISKHITGSELLTSPYKIIASDADNSGVVDSTDILLLRDLIFGFTDEIPGGNIKYVLKDYIFPEPMAPLDPPYPNKFSISNLQAGISNVDFIGIKVGDLNGSSFVDGCDEVDMPIHISGTVFRDEVSDCQFNVGESPLAGWTISATNGLNTYFATTNQSGAYEIQLLPGTYDVSISTPVDLWVPCVETIHNVTASLTSGDPVDFPVQAVSACPFMDVDVSTPRLLRCFSNAYNLQYCNLGTATAENARVELDLDPLFIYESSTLPATLIGGNTYSFEIGDIPSGVCDQFTVTFTLSCDATLGQTHCVEARIFPDSICSPALAWTGPELSVEGACDGDDAVFTITNSGALMSEPSNYIVVEDIVVMMPPVQNPFILGSGGSEIITIPADGKTIRLEVNQPAGYPWSQQASATVEGCGTNSSGSFSIGMVNLFPQNDESPFVDIDCRQNTGSFDPNDKQGFPTGVFEEHYVPLQQPLDYLIRFQNTGTDTAFTVVIRDTLDQDLDPKTVRALGSSHPYTFNLSSEGVAQFIFTNIMLPDSNVNEAASHGFVKFSIAPKAGAIDGTRIENEAAIFFDFNEPVFTNTTWHTLGSKYLSSSNIFIPDLGLELFPNPGTDDFNFLIKSAQTQSGVLTISDATGRVIMSESFDHNQFIVKGAALKSGYYFFRIESDQRILASGKLIKID